MSVLIKGMEMPKSCYKCPMRKREGMDIVCPVVRERFSVADVNILNYRLDNCPLFPVPPHGRLIDADEFCTEHRSLKMLRKVGLRRFNWHIAAAAFVDDTPIVIPASGKDVDFTTKVETT